MRRTRGSSARKAGIMAGYTKASKLGGGMGNRTKRGSSKLSTKRGSVAKGSLGKRAY